MPKRPSGYRGGPKVGKKMTAHITKKRPKKGGR